MNWGIGYKGSKSGIAEWVVERLPRGRILYDLFFGGGAVTHCAMAQRRYERFVANDVEDTPRLFCDAVNGKFRNETRWISRADFARLKSVEPYVKYCWSFGNNGEDYLYAEEIEPYKRAAHYAIVFDDWREYDALCGETAGAAKRALRGKTDIKARRLAFGPAVIAELKRFDDWRVVVGNPFYFSAHWRGGKLDGAHVDLQSLQSLERLQRLQSLQSLQSLERLERLVAYRGDYRDVPIDADGVVYCDIPYAGTDEYASGAFDYGAFYGWVARQDALVVISEYAMPAEFVCVDKIKKRQKFNGLGTGKQVQEKLFVHKKQIEKYNEMMTASRRSDGWLS